MRILMIAILAALTLLLLAWAEGVKAAGITVKVTSYNPSAAQTDHSPCTGASLRNLCTAAKEGDRTIALSRDLLRPWGGPFRWRDKVRLTSTNPACAGVYSVEDTMHHRFTLRADLFFMDRRKNTNCTATLSKL